MCALSSIQERRDMCTKPLNQGLQVGLIKWTERPSTWIKRPTCSTYRNPLGRNTTMEFMHPWVKMSAKWEAEMSQTQAGRPTNCHTSTRRNHYRPPGVIKSIHEKAVQIWQRSQADQPRGGRPASLCHSSSPSFTWKLSSRPTCVKCTR